MTVEESHELEHGPGISCKDVSRDDEGLLLRMWKAGTTQVLAMIYRCHNKGREHDPLLRLSGSEDILARC